MKVDQNNNIYITGFSSIDTFKLDILTLKINSDGITDWHNIIRNDYDDVPSGLAIDSEGNCYLAGGLGDIFLDEASVTLRYNTDGAQAWIDTQETAWNVLLLIRITIFILFLMDPKFILLSMILRGIFCWNLQMIRVTPVINSIQDCSQ